MKRLLFLFVFVVVSALLKAQVFTNQIASSGLPTNKGFVHAIFDYNNDGFEDLIYSVPVGSARYLTLYKNNGNTTFTNVTTTVGLPTNLLMSEAQGPIGVVTTDYNNDGLKDLIVLQLPASIKVYKNNCGLTFTDVTSALGIPSPLSSTTEITSFAVPSDFDKDGDVDYIISRTLANNNRVVTAIKNNLASNTFSFQDLFTVSNTNAFAAQIRSIDYDNDQDDDLLFIIQVPKASYAASAGRFCLQTIKLYKNNSGSFVDVPFYSGSSANSEDAYVANGPVIFDYDNDGWLDVLYTSEDGYQSKWVDPNGAEAITKFYRNIGKFNGGAVAFVDSSARNATDNLFPNTEAYYWFSSSMDFDNDADFDVFHGIGWCTTTQHQLLKNNNNRFKDSAFAHGLNINGNVCAGNGANVWFDVDKDGDLDAFINDFNGDSYLMINPLNTQQAKYLRIKLSGCTSNKEARGTKVSVKVGNKYLTEYFGFSKGSNYNASDIFHFGLGNVSTADSVIVYWPSGLKTQLGSTAANQLLFISEAACTNTQSLSFMLPDTLKTCGDSSIIDAGAGYTSYTWNTGSITSSIYAKATGWYKVTVSNGTCTATDSVYVSLLKAKITASKLRICKGETVTLQADTTVGSFLACAKTDLPSNLQTGLVAYYPFCGNANDASGNGNNGTVNGATLTTDRFGSVNSAYSFNRSQSNHISLNTTVGNFGTSNFSVGGWQKRAPNASVYCMFGKRDAYGGGNFFEVNSNPGFEINQSSGSDYINDNNLNVINNSQWFYSLIVRDGTQILIYINGVLVNTFNSPIIHNVNNSALSEIGARYAGSSLAQLYDGMLDDIGIWNRALSASEIQQYYNSSAPQTQTYTWNTGATSSAISVTPTTTTKYYLTVNNGTSTCIDSVTIVVDTISPPTLPNNLNACGDSVLLNPASNGKYLWNTGDNTASIYAKATGTYKVSITNGVCTATDSVYVSLVKAKITASKTRICKGETITLQADTNISANVACAKTDLPSNLQTGLVAYYPFCGNANDASGNGNHGTVNGATLDDDRLGNNSGSYYFDSNDYIEVATNNSNAQDLTNNFTISSWFKIETTSVFNTILSKAVCGQANVNGYIFGLQDFPTLGLNSKVHFQASPIMSDATPVLPDSNGIVRKNGCDWQNFTVTYNKQTQILKYYLNGKLVFTKNILFTILNNATIKLIIGNHFNQPLQSCNGPFKGWIDDIAIWQRELTNTEVSQYLNGGATNKFSYVWSNGSKKSFISINPVQTSTYKLSSLNCISSCTDSITIVVDTLTPPTLPDNLNACGDSVLLNPASNGKYLWNTGDTTASIYAKATGTYKVSITNGVCAATDSSYVSLVKAKITASKTRICKGDSVTLGSNSSNLQLKQCDKSGLAPNLQNGLVGYWPFCGNANDASGNGNNGTVNGATLTTDRFGQVNSAYSFNNNLISVPHKSNLGFTSNDGFTISVWCNKNTNNPWTHLVGKRPVGSQVFNWQLAYSSDPGFGTNFGTCMPPSNYVGAFDNQTLQNNIWVHIVGIYDHGTWKLYLNGVLNKTNTAGLMNDFVCDLTFGNSGNISHQPFIGSLDDIGIWNRALSASEIQQLFASGQTYNWTRNNTSGSLGTDTVLTVTPATTTTYTLTVGNGISTCTDQVTVEVDALTSPTLPNNLNACGDSVLLNPASNGKYLWNTGDTTASIYAKATGTYKVSITNGVCTASDSVNVSLLKAKITASKLRICKGETVTLFADSSADINYNRNYCASNDIPSQLKSGLMRIIHFVAMCWI